jgi:hypothetical protein
LQCLAWCQSKSSRKRRNQEKEILGFIVDGLNWMVRISEEKVAGIIAKIRKVLKKKRVQLQHYRCIMGKLCHDALMMPSTRGLFSPVNKALQGEPAPLGLSRTSKVRTTALLDLVTMEAQLGAHVTYMKELVLDNDRAGGFGSAATYIWKQMSGE